jgi:Protein of unknown function (DUF3054)
MWKMEYKVVLFLGLAAVSSLMFLPCCSGFISRPGSPMNGRAVMRDNRRGNRIVFPTIVPVAPGAKKVSLGSSSSSSSSRRVTQDGAEPTTTPSSSSPLDRPGLALVDLISLLAFAAIGKASHAAGDGSILEEMAGVATTAFPFVVSWFATSFVTGVYGRLKTSDDDDDADDPKLPSASRVVAASWAQTARGWILAIPLGCVGRGLLRGYPPPIPFVVVTMIATLVILGAARMAYNYYIEVVANQSTTKNE